MEDTTYRPFEWINRADPASLLSALTYELPQTIAFVLSCIDPNKSSIILQNLHHEVQADVLRRIACMDCVSPKVCRKVESVLQKKLLNSNNSYITNGGVDEAVYILNLVDRASEKQIIEALEDDDPELAEEIKRRMFIFENIVMLNDRDIQKVLREVDSQELAKSLINANTKVQDKIFRNMSKRASAMLKEDITYMGPVRLSDVEEAQQKIVSIIRHLEDCGEIIVPRSMEDELVQASFSPEEEEE